MKVVILAGGFGTRISEESAFKPKPMIEIGGMPILWHIMKTYSYYGFHEFVICAGYKQHVIKEWFADYFLHTSDITFDYTNGNNEMIVHNKHVEPWKVTIVDTGLNTQTGGRVKRIRDYIGNEPFMLTYGDAVGDRGLYNHLSDEEYIKRRYKALVGKEIDLDHPKSFNEKLQWLKIHYRIPELTTMVDKSTAKEYVSALIGKEYIIPTLGVWDHFDDIDFSSLPEKFVLKCTHDSGGLVICKDKSTLDLEKTRNKIEKSLRKNFYWNGREWPYKNVPPRIIAEQYLEEKNEGTSIDRPIDNYKFLCSRGRCFAFYITIGGGHNVGTTLTYFDIQKNRLPVEHYQFKPHPSPIRLSEQADSMMRLAEKLSEALPFGRIDFYCVNNQIFFGEITLYPDSGFGKLVPEEYDVIWGKEIELPEERVCKSNG